MVEGAEYQLICEIIDVAPVKNLRVSWYRGSELVETEHFPDTGVFPVDVNSTLRVTPERDDNGAQFRCVAELHLGPNGPEPAPNATSIPYTAVVFCEFFTYLFDIALYLTLSPFTPAQWPCG